MSKSIFEKKIEEVCKKYEIDSDLIYDLLDLQAEYENSSQKIQIKKFNIVKEKINKEILK